MSGFVGVAGPACLDDDWRWVRQATDFMAFRGPHSHGAWRDTRAALGHTLLRTCAEDDAAQLPLTLDGEVWITGDVRLDARGELLRGLRAQGRDASLDRPDIELVLEAYHAWDVECLTHLAGDFAFSIWDRRRGRLFAARDQFGVAPFYYAMSGERVLFSNTLDALLLHPQVSDDLDDQAVVDFLLFNMHVDLAGTTFAKIRRLPPAHTLTWSGGTVQLRRYWSMPEWSAFASFERPTDYVERFRDLLTDAVADRLRTYRLSVQLSGGLDSTSVAATVKQVLGAAGKPYELRAHTLVGGRTGYEEGSYASMVAEHLDIPLEQLVASEYQDIDPLERPPVLPPEPGPYTSTALQYDLARRASESGHVALSGLGGDALLMFVPSYWLEWLAQGEVMRFAAAITHNLKVFHRPPSLYVRAALRHWRRARMQVPRVPEWVEPEFAARKGLASRIEQVNRTSLAAIDTRGMADSPFWSCLFGRADPGFTRLPVKYRHPLFDLRLVSYVLSLPPASWLVRKRLLREAMHGVLPEPVRSRPKTPLASNQASLRPRGAGERVLALVAAVPAMDRYTDRAALASRLRSMDAADIPTQRALMSSLALAHWLHHWRRPTAGRTPPGSTAVRQLERQPEVVS